MAFKKYRFDVRRLWATPANDAEAPSCVAKPISLVVIDVRAVSLAAAAFLQTKKRSTKAAARCRRRVNRALTTVRSSVAAPGVSTDAALLASGAEVWIRQACALCGRCPPS